MDHLALALAGSTGILLRRDAVANGIDDNALTRLVRMGVLVRIRQGAYVVRSVWTGLDRTGRHHLLSEAVMRQYGDHVALSHTSAVLALGGPDWGLDLSSVHLTHLEGGGRRTAGVVHHHGDVRVEDLTRATDHWVTSPTRTVLDIATIAPSEVAVVTASDFLHRGLTTPEQLQRMESDRRTWPHSLGVHVVHHLADARLESVAEARSFHLFWSQGLPRPEPQWPFFRNDGTLIGRVDFAWPKYRLLCEFDGRIKYERLRREGESLEDAILREKRRQEAIHEVTGWRIIRLVWADLAAPERTAERIRRLMRAAA